MKRTLQLYLAAPIILSMSMFSFFGLALHANALVTPETVDATLVPGQSMEVEKTVTLPDLPPLIDVCLLEDETGSFFDDIANLQSGTTAQDIYDDITAVSPGAQFAVAGFRDYPVSPYGSPGDYVYRLLSSMSTSNVDWLAGIAALTAGGGNDLPEAQYDAIVAAAGPGIFADPALGDQPDCGWRDLAANPGLQRVLVVTTDAPFHVGPDGSHVHDDPSTIAALNAQHITVVGLKAPGAGTELDSLAAATGGVVEALSTDGSNIASAIITGLSRVTTDVWWEASCDPELSVSLNPAVHLGVAAGSSVNFDETIALAGDAAVGTYECVVTFLANTYPEEGTPVGREVITIAVEDDDAAPMAMCLESVNPHGETTPPAGSTTLPGPRGGQNEDGFYLLGAADPDGDEDLKIWVSGFGPFEVGDVVKITESNDNAVSMKKIGNDNGKAGAVKAHLILASDAVVTAIDSAGNVSDPVICYVPEPPK